MSNYRFEHYRNAAVSRSWMERFYIEHEQNSVLLHIGVRPSKKQILKVMSPTINRIMQAGESDYIRIFYQNKLIGFARTAMEKMGQSEQKAVSINTAQELYILPPNRNTGHFHFMFDELVDFAKVEAILLGKHNADKHCQWYVSKGFSYTIQSPRAANWYFVTESAKEKMMNV